MPPLLLLLVGDFLWPLSPLTPSDLVLGCKIKHTLLHLEVVYKFCQHIICLAAGFFSPLAYCTPVHLTLCNTNTSGGCPPGVMVKVMDCGIVVSEFIFHSCYYVHFWVNTLGKGMTPPYPPSYVLNSTITVLLGEWLWH